MSTFSNDAHPPEIRGQKTIVNVMKSKDKTKSVPDRKPERLKLARHWQGAVKRSLPKKKPARGWPCFKLNMKIEINGKRIVANNFAAEVDRVYAKAAIKSATDALDGLIDPNTGAAPKITFFGDSIADLEVHIIGSDAVVEQARKRVAFLSE
jgi:hypothetical protein